MACDWIKVRSELPSDTRVLSIAARLKVSPVHVVGAVVVLWSLADRHSTDGTLKGMSMDAVDLAVGMPGFAAACSASGWLEQADESSVRIPRFEKHNGATSKARAQGAARAKAHRERPPVPAHDERDVSVTPPGTTITPPSRPRRDARVTPPLQKRDEGRTVGVTAAHGQRTQESEQEQENPLGGGCASSSPPSAAAPAVTVPSRTEPQEKQPPPPQPVRADGARKSAGSGGTGTGVGHRGAGGGASHPLLTAAAWRPAASEADLKRLDLVLIDVKLAAERGQITLLRTPGGGCESALEFLIRRALAYGASDTGRKFPTSLRKFLFGDGERGGYWLDPDERWADVTPTRKGGSGGADGGMNPEQVRALQERNAADLQRRRDQTEAHEARLAAMTPEEREAARRNVSELVRSTKDLIASRSNGEHPSGPVALGPNTKRIPTPEEQAGIDEANAHLERLRAARNVRPAQNGSHPKPGTLNPEPAGLLAGGEACRS